MRIKTIIRYLIIDDGECLGEFETREEAYKEITDLKELNGLLAGKPRELNKCMDRRCRNLLHNDCQPGTYGCYCFNEVVLLSDIDDYNCPAGNK